MSDFATSLCSLASSLLSLFVPTAVMPSRESGGAVGATSVGDFTDIESIPIREQCSRLSAGGKGMLFARRMVSSCSTLVSR